MTAGSQHPGELGEHRFEVGDVGQREGGDHQIHRIVAQR